ncbi:MAG TPA: hypothetical protein VIH99_01780 [Bdellovibrionota bacterium]|jgi:hypothetical protein
MTKREGAGRFQRLFLFFFLLMSAHADAQDVRKGYMSLSWSTGSSEYSSVGLVAKPGLDPQWRLDTAAFFSHSGASGDTNVLFVGADVNVEDTWNFRFGLQGSKEPNSLSSFGFAPGATWEISSLWEGELDTLVSLDLERSRYSQGSRASAFVQKVVRLEITQEFSEEVSASFAAAKYGYDEDGALINRAVGSRRRSPGSIDSYVAGFPESALEIRMDWSPNEAWTISPHMGRVKSVQGDQVTTNAGLGASVSVAERWSLGFDFTHSKPEYGTKTDVGTLDVKYSL